MNNQTLLFGLDAPLNGFTQTLTSEQLATLSGLLKQSEIQQSLCDPECQKRKAMETLTSRINSLQDALGTLHAQKTALNFGTQTISAKSDNQKQINKLTKEIQIEAEKLQKEIATSEQTIENQNKTLNLKNKALDNVKKEYQMQDNLLDEQLQLLDTRKRMLEVSEQKNIHKQKVIYSYLALIIAIGAILAIIFMVFRPSSPNLTM